MALHRTVSRARVRLGVGAWGIAILAAGSSCASVEPQHDFERAAGTVKDRLDVDDVYDPAAEALIEAKVTRLLADGLTVDEAVRVALLNNRSFQALFQTIGASRADVVQSGLLTNPSIGLTARFPEGGGRSNLTVTFAQELVDLWQIPVRRRIAEAELEQTIGEVVRQAIDLAADVRAKWYELATLRKSEAIAQENLQLVQKSIDIAESRLRAGEAGQIDVNLLRAGEVNVRAALLEFSRDRSVAKSDLARALGLARWNQPWDLAETDDPQVLTLPDDATLVVLAMRQRMEARMAEYQVKAAEGELERERLNVFPSVAVGIEGERVEKRALPGRKIAADTARTSIRQGQLAAPDIQTRGERNIERAQMIDLLLGPSIQITLPIWDQNQARIAKAFYRVEEVRKRYEDLLDEISNEVQRAAAVVRASAELMAFYEQTGVPTARENLELARKAYEGGEQNIIAVIEAQEFLMVQRQTTAKVRRDYLVALAELGRALGGKWTPAPEAIPAAPEGDG